MINFIPTSFAGDEETCPVCIARTDLETKLAQEESAFLTLGQRLITADGVNEEIAETYASVQNAYRKLISDYRVAFAINLGIWFSAERFGRVKKVPDLIIAYDEYRNESVGAFESYNLSCDAFFAAVQNSVFSSALKAEHEALLESHTALRASVQNFWAVVDAWTVKRREDAFKLL